MPSPMKALIPNIGHDLTTQQPKTVILLPVFDRNPLQLIPMESRLSEALPPPSAKTSATHANTAKSNAETAEWTPAAGAVIKSKSALVNNDEAADSGVIFPPEICGYLSKWTNYIHGWQHRYFVLREGVFSYFKSQEDITSGCRGAIRIGRAEIRTYDFDNCRFDVAVNDTYWHLRAMQSDEKDRWLCAVEAHRSILEQSNFSAAGTPGQRRSPSLMSLQSVLSETRSTNSAAFQQHANSHAATNESSTTAITSGASRSLDERTLELLGLKNLLLTQLDNFQTQLQSVSSSSSGSNIISGDSGDSPPNLTNSKSTASRQTEPASSSLKHEIAAFRLTAQSMAQAVTNCCELFQQHEQTTNARIERERQRRAKLKHAYQHVCEKLATSTEQRAVLQRQYNDLVRQRADALAGKPSQISPSTSVNSSLPAASNAATTMQQPLYGPDFQEGPHGRLNEEEFFDAIDAALDREEEVDAEESRQKLVFERLQSQTKDVMQMQQQIQRQMREKEKVDTAARLADEPSNVSKSAVEDGTKINAEKAIQPDGIVAPAPTPNHLVASLDVQHIDPHLAHVPQEIQEVVREQYDYALSPPDDGVWQLFVEEGDMRMYRREIEEGGLPIDPLKAQHIVYGVTAREIAYYFYAPETRMEWETTVDKVDVVVSLSENTKIFYQLHKRVWPTAQRESLFWSHMRKEEDLTRKFDSSSRNHVIDSWIVCNKSIELDDIQCGGGRVRVGLKICLVCQTYVPKEKANVPLSALKRSDVHTRLAYCACVNPGGWVPAAGMRQVYKREYPRFLRKYTKYVSDKVKSKPLMWDK